ncbi:MAG: type II toxin-antitoxin system Phd/YefM family antitoxin [Nitrospinae bacterium]|nr:type II toxin-antitoxin system Phd/YefM family antitoxin [Nitrospinota bacterium]
MAIKSISMSELRQQLTDILATLEATGEPYFITQYSRPKAVLVRYADDNALTELATTAHPYRGTRITVRHIVESPVRTIETNVY